MGDYLRLDHCHLSFHIPNDLDDAACDSIKRIRESRRFRSALRRAIRKFVRKYPELDPIQRRISV